jgi:hypothetical protein
MIMILHLSAGRNEGRKEGRKGGTKEGRQEGREERRKEGRGEGRKEGMEERKTEGRRERKNEGRKGETKEGREEGRRERCRVWPLDFRFKLQQDKQLLLYRAPRMEYLSKSCHLWLLFTWPERCTCVPLRPLVLFPSTVGK